jgi:hypothetical protein
MPLYARPYDAHYPDADASPHADHHVVLCGNFGCGGFHRVTTGPSAGTWQWGTHLTADPNFGAVGTADSATECAAHIGRAFRAMLARADLRERQEATAGLPRRETAGADGQPSAPAQSHDRDADRRGGQMTRNERRLIVRSGELTVGVLARATHWPESWAWFLTGLPRPHDPHFTWQGHADNEQEAFAAFERCWQQWLAWAGLEQVDELSAA